MCEIFPNAPAPRAGFLFLKAQRPILKSGRFAVLIWLVLFPALALSACDSLTSPEALSPPPGEAAGESADASAANIPEPEPYPQTHTDVLGRVVTIESRPEAIVSLAPSVTEILFAVGAGSQVIGRTEYDNFPAEVESLPTIGGFTSDSISIETILELEPDLVVGGASGQVEVAEALEETGITVFVVEPESVNDILGTIQTLGDITGHPVEAEALLAELISRIAAVTDVVGDIPADERVTLFYEVWHEPLMTATGSTFTGEVIQLAGGVNIFGELEESYPTISAEQIVELNPDAIVGPSSHSDQLSVELIAERPGWENLTAVQEASVYIVDGDIVSRPGPRVVDALELIAAAIYPELFTEP